MKKKLNRFVKENRWVLITFIISCIIISVIYTLQKIAPFGNNSLLTIDFYHQYGPMLNELVDRIKEGKTFLYSFNTGGGIPFYRNFLNYLSSPFNIILLLFKKESIVMAFSVIIALKAVAAATFMSYFLKKAFNKSNVLITIFGVLYAFSGYFCAYYWNIMWLDGMVFLPLVTLGAKKIVDEEKPLFYMFMLGLMLFANYFIGYMICIFEVIFFLAYFLYRGNFRFNNILKKFILFGVFSILAAGIVSFALMPLYESLSSISATKDTFPAFSFSFSPLKYFFNHISGVNPTIFASDIMPLPNVSTGLITLFAILIMFFNKKVNVKVKVLTFATILFFFLSFDCTTFDFVWHAFHIPNDLPWRYSFIYVFVISILAYYSLIKVKEVKQIFIYICFGILSLFVLLSSELNFENIDAVKSVTCFLFLACYLVLFILYLNKKLPKLIFSIIFLAFISGEAIYQINSNWQIDHDIGIFMSNKKPYTVLIERVKKDDNGLYRMEKTASLTLNDGSWYNYYGMSTFSSMAYEDVAKFQRKFGMSGNNINSYYYQHYQTPVYNTVFNIKYLLGNYIENDYYTPIDSVDTFNLIRYNYSSSIGFRVDKGIKKLNLTYDDPFLNQSNFVRLLVGDKYVYNPIKVIDIIGGEITSYDDGNYYIETDGVSKKLKLILDNEKSQNIYLYVNGYNVSDFFLDGIYYYVTSDEFYTVDTGKKDKGLVTVEINLKEPSGGVMISSYSINDEVFKEFYNEVNNGMINVNSYNETIINGDMDIKKDGIMFTSLAYDEGWVVYVDGKKVKTFKLMDSYLGFDVKEGKHKIKLKYYPKGLKTGIVTSVISYIIVIIYILLFKGENRKKQIKIKKIK